MKEPHLLRVEHGPEGFRPLFEAAAAGGLRVGWLELDEPAPLPPALEAAAGLGALRAVAVGGGRSAAVKPMKGRPVLRDLVREHFRGCALVLVRGDVEAPLLAADGIGFRVAAPEHPAAFATAADLAAALRKPRPW